MRHWREKWDPKAALVWNRGLLFADKRVKPGDRVTKAQREKLGKHREKLWWNAGYFRLAK